MFRTTASLALVASGLIALSACSSGPSASGSSPVGAPESLSPAASAPTSSDHIGQLTEVFATPLPGDPAKAKVIEEWRQSEIVWDQSAESLRMAASASTYITGKALTSLQNTVQIGVEAKMILSGTDRLFNTSVTALTADRATVTSCDDGSETLYENSGTGQEFSNPSPTVLVIWQMTPKAGHWAMTSLTVVSSPDPRERACATT